MCEYARIKLYDFNNMEFGEIREITWQASISPEEVIQ